MNARTCMACGSDAADDATSCSACGHELEPRLFHEASDVRLEAERLGEAVPEQDVPLPPGAWGRASEHPHGGRSLSHPPTAEVVEHATASAAPAGPERDARPAPREGAREAAMLEAAARNAAEERPGVATPAEVRSPQDGPGPEPWRTISDTWQAAGGHAAIEAWHSATAHVPAPSHTGSHPVVTRPPVLASEALQRDLAPAEPSPQLLRFWGPALGLLGTCAVWVLTHGRGIGVPLAGAFAALALLGLPRMSYAARAGAMATVAATGLALVLWADTGSEHRPRAMVLTLTVNVLATGLLFRAWHRASALARLIVMLGVVLGVGYLWMSETFTSLTMLDTAWQSWVPRLVFLPFGLLLMLSLLVFMNARTTAGAAAWAALLLLWYALHAAVELLYAAWPKELDEPDFSRLGLDTILAWSSAPIFAALLSLGLAQLIASVVARSISVARSRQILLAH